MAADIADLSLKGLDLIAEPTIVQCDLLRQGTDRPQRDNTHEDDRDEGGPRDRDPKPEEQIVYAVKQSEAGKKAADICRELGVSEQTFYTWKRRYRGARAPRAAAVTRRKP